ncbi:RagB/SusD family nutrient uptake outer membrane protein [uncultured Chitinophaga sp.]|uniref:RagB/SusD family nutrient uptake outer membrane protein n=1 Tax=uncultured Chitinophaga sp. TaxID=339340 RepID=UPI0025E206B7|nr:RagB/SusD family nutrient uptake outer membrane protein [uncultured Chitinophaga sp.]
MKMLKKTIPLFLCITALVACQKDWLDRKPRNILTDDQVLNDPSQIVGVLANFYSRLPSDQGLDDIADGGDRISQWRNMANYDDAMWSGQSNEDWRNNIFGYDFFGSWYLWNYGLIRDINLMIDNITTKSTQLTAGQKTQFLAELRFIRAFNYFQLVKRMGGVPLVTTQLLYDYSGDASKLQQPRAKEAEVYDFIASEVDAIKEDLGNGGSITRATKFTALALKSRAMLYAASIAKYNALNTPQITTPGGEVGIPATRANEYYDKALIASQEIITTSPFRLYRNNTGNLGENFYEAVNKKATNGEVIFVKDYLAAKDKRHFFAYDNIVRSIREDNLGSSSVTPSLNLVESFDYLDGSNGAVKTRTADNSDYIYYDKIEDIFANKDARLYGTVVYGGAPFKGTVIDMQAGVMVWNGTAYQTTEGNDLATKYTDGGTLVAAAGPHRAIQEVSNTGFYLRKFVDATPQSSTRGVRSDNWWVWFRLGEIYLNASEAAFELGRTGEALGYINELRVRAGFPPNSLTTLSIAKIQSERRVELAFEDHRLWDLKRWRIADQVWNGVNDNPNARVYALYPYRVIRPGDAARNNKFVFVKMVAPRFGAPRNFQLQNYYTFISQDVMNNNPKIVKNPLQ